MPILLVITKRCEGQRVTSRCQPATQTNRDPNCDKNLCDSTSNGTDQCQNCSPNLLTPYREQPPSTRIVATYPRPAFSTTKRTNYAPISFNQQVQVSQSHTSYRIKKNGNTEVHGGGDLKLVKAGTRASIHPSKALCIPEKGPRILPVRRALLAFVGRKKTVVRHQLFSQKPPGSRL